MPLIKVREKNDLEAIRVTTEILHEPGQKTIRECITGVISVEAYPARMIFSTITKRFVIHEGDWIVRGKETIVLSDFDFHQRFEKV